MWVCSCVCAYAHSGQKRASGPLELELKAVASHHTWVLETQLRSSTVAVCALNCWSISAPICICYYFDLLDMSDRNGRDSPVRCKICRIKDPITGIIKKKKKALTTRTREVAFVCWVFYFNVFNTEANHLTHSSIFWALFTLSLCLVCFLLKKKWPLSLFEWPFSPCIMHIHSLCLFRSYCLSQFWMFEEGVMVHTYQELPPLSTPRPWLQL